MNLRRASRKSYGAGSQGARRVGRKPRPERATRGGSTPGATKHAPARRGPLRSGPAAIERPSELTPRWPDVSGLLKRQPWDDLIPHLLRIGADPAASTSRIRRYCELIIQWNRKVSNIISKNDEARIVARHVIESLEPARWLQDLGAKRWLDFGSGAGLPAIPLALCGIGNEWTLVESRRTKTLFLRKALEELGMKNITVVHSRLEELLDARDHSSSYDGFTSRATLPLAPTLAMAASFVQPQGTAFLWKGSRREEEMAGDRSWLEKWDLEGLLGIGDGTTAVARFKRK